VSILAEGVVTVVWCFIWFAALGIAVYFTDAEKRRRTLVITSLLFAALPVWWWGRYPYYSYVAERDYTIFQELCKKYAQDKIVRRVEGVEAVFQMRARDASGEITHRRNQYLMEDPFGAIGDVGSGFGPDRYLDRRAGGGAYKIFERPRDLRSDGPPFVRYVAEQSDQMPAQIQKQATTQVVSVYGYLWEDISTPDMRSRWIAGGKIKVVDLASKQVLAERTGFVFARYLNGALVKYPWTNASLTCPAKHSTSHFVKNVLVPKP